MKYSTTIECPCCNRRIDLALKPPFIETALVSGFDSETCEVKYHSLQDILYLHGEILAENKRLKEYLLAETSKFRSSYGDY